MNQVVVRVMLAVLLIAAIPLICTVSAVILYQWFRVRGDSWIFGGFLITACYLVVGWHAIWHGQIIWTGRRSVLTGLSLFGALLPAMVLGAAVSALAGDDIGMVTGACVWALVWLTSTLFVWRESPAEWALRLGRAPGNVVGCPNCGYNLTGLYEARCPECGSRYTLDQLLAAMFPPSALGESSVPPRARHSLGLVGPGEPDHQ
jgi:hypothetical protein